MRIRRTITEPSGKHRVEIRQQRDGFEVEQWAVVNKKWRRVESPLDGRTFESYAAAVFAIQQQNSWLGNALMDELGTGSGYHLEMTRGLAFRLAVYREDVFGDHHHCDNCWVKFMEYDAPGIQHEGYVAKYFVPGGAGHWQWNWVCRECFASFRKRLQWEVEP